MLIIGSITKILQIMGVNINAPINAIIIALFFLPLEVLLHHISKTSQNNTNKILSKIIFLFIIVCYLGGLISTIILLI